MGTAKLDVALADRRHADLVISAREKAGEGCRKGYLAASCQPHRHSDHVLLRDITFDETLWRYTCELLGVGGILYVSIKTHDAMIHFSNCGQCLSKRFSSCHFLVADLVR